MGESALVVFGRVGELALVEVGRLDVQGLVLVVQSLV